VVSAPGQQASLLAVMKHPDDPELWADGTIVLHARDATVTLAVTEHEAARMAEAAAILGARLVVLPALIALTSWAWAGSLRGELWATTAGFAALPWLHQDAGDLAASAR
jgi:hypothetical protein